MSFRGKILPVVAIVLGCACAALAGGELRFCINGEPKTLEPNLATDETSETVQYLTAGVLIRVNRRTQELQPELAVSWEIARDGKSARFQLRRGVRFSDGTTFGAEDVAYTFRRLAAPESPSPIADSFLPSGGQIEAAADGSHVVTIRFPEPVAGMERLFDQVAITSATSPLKSKAVLGPFVVDEHRPGVYIRLKRNPNYWKKDANGRQLPYLDAVRLEMQQNPEIEMLRLQRGQIHLVNEVEPGHFERISRDKRVRAVDAGPSLDMEMLWFNMVSRAPIPNHKKRWFQSQGFRRAVSEAIRREDLCRIVYGGHARPGVGPISPANRFWFRQGLAPHPYNPQAALARLREEGFRKQGEVLVDRDGNTVEFSLITNAGNRARERMAAMIQEDLGKIGIKLTVVPLDFRALLERITRNFDYEACLLGFVNVDLDPNAQMNVWLSSASQHPWNPGQKSPETPWEAEIDKLMRAQASSTDPAERKRSFDRVQQIVWEQAPMLYLVHKNTLIAYSPLLQNVEPSVLRPQSYWNVERLSLKQPAGK